MGLLQNTQQQLDANKYLVEQEEARHDAQVEIRKQMAEQFAIDFQKNELNDVSLPLVVIRNQNKLSVVKHNKKLVEISFNSSTPHFIKYFADFQPSNSQKYQHIQAGHNYEFYTHVNYAGLRFLGEFLLIFSKLKI